MRENTTPINVLEDDSVAVARTRVGPCWRSLTISRPARRSISQRPTPVSTAWPTTSSALRDAGAKVIADDVTYFDEPMFQEGPIDVAIDNVTSSGVSYFSSAGNENVVVGGHNVGSYEAPAYRPTSCPARVNNFASSHGFSYLDCHDFDPGAGVDNGAGLHARHRDYSSRSISSGPSPGTESAPTSISSSLDAGTGNVLASSTYRNSGVSGTQEPFEWAAYQQHDRSPGERGSRHRSLFGDGAAAAQVRDYPMASGYLTGAEYNSSNGGDIVGPTIFGHNGGQNTITVAAVPYNDSTTPESYTSHGPVTYYYGPVNDSTPAAPLSSPLVLSKPDIAATDCAQTSFFSATPARLTTSVAPPRRRLTRRPWQRSCSSTTFSHPASVRADCGRPGARLQTAARAMSSARG